MRFTDESLFFAHLASANPQVFNLVVQCRVRGRVDARRWADSIEQVFGWHGLPERRFEAGLIDRAQAAEPRSHGREIVIHECADAEAAEALARVLVEAEKEFVFDISQDVLFRNTLIVAPEQALWLLNLHHGMADGWSISLLINQVERCYTHGELPQACGTGREEVDRRDSVDTRDLTFWRDTFATAHRNSEAAAELASTPRAARHDHRFTSRDSERIYAYCRLHGISLNDFFTALLAAYLFHSHSLQCITFEVSLHGRASLADKASVGKYVKFVPLNLELSEQLGFSELCRNVQSRSRRLLRHHRFAIHSSDSRERGLVRPSMPFAINYQNSKHTNRFAGHPLDVDWVFTGYDEHWLTLNVNDFQDEEITLSVDLNDSVFDPNCQALVLQRLVAIASTVLEQNPAIGDISPLCDTDRAVLGGSRNTVATATDGLFHLGWLAEPPRFPSANAVLAQDVALSHGEFRARINDCRDVLRQAGCGPESRVAVCLDNGWPAMAWVYAIWLESAAYVPIDHDAPRARADAIAAASSARLLVSDRPELQELPGCHTLPAIPSPADTSGGDAGFSGIADPDSIAYILFTSGSTGTPKGVMVSHRAISEYAAQFVAYFDISSSDTVLQQASLAFDASFEEFVPVLAVGGAVVPCNRYRLLEPGCLLSVLHRYAVSVISVSPILMGELNRQFRDLPSLRLAISGGDVLDWRQCDRLVAHGVAVYNTYGPTEATICATYKRVDGARITIGRPIRNTNVYVVNERMGLVGIGVPGQLAIAGVGVAKGYLDDPETSAARFRGNPFAQSCHDRTLYLTGDRGILTDSGELAFLGRTDDQVSINGYRVELKEVEAGILSCPDVESSAVWFDPASRRLAACYTGRAEVAEVKAFLLSRLPRHMIPHGWHRLDALPLNQSGKIDIGRLRGSCSDAIPADEPGVALSPFALEVAALWREVLETDANIGASSCFYALGGNSLKLLELVRMYANRLGVACALSPLLSDSTLSSHVAVLAPAQSQLVPAFARFSPVDRWPATPQQRAMITEERGSGRAGLYNVPGVVSWTGGLDRRRFALSLEILRRRHAILQCELNVDGTFACAPHRPIELTFESADSVGPVEAWLSSSTAVDLLASGRLPWQVSVLEHETARYTVLFLFHHALVDAWSLRVLDQEFQDIYSELGHGSADADGPATASPAYDFSSYAQWIAGRPTSMSDREKQMVVDEFGQWPELFAIESDGHAEIAASAVYERRAPASWSRDVAAFCSEHRLSLHNVLQSLFALTLCRWMDSPAVVMGMPASNRDSSAAASLVGCFINTVLAKTAPQADESVADLLRRSALAEQQRSAMSSVPLQQVLSCLLEAGCHVPTSPIEVYFAIDDIPRRVHDLDERCVQPMDHQLEPGRSTIALVIVTGAEGWRLQWKYSARHFDERRVAALAEYYEQTVLGAISAPSQRLRDLMGLEWQQSRIASPEPPCDVEQCLIEQIRQQVVRQPHARALVAGSRHYTYSALWQEAERYAFALDESGVGPGDFIVLALQKCPEFVQLVLAAWMVGAAVAPHDGELWFDADEQWCAENAVRLIVHDRVRGPHRRPARGASLDEIDALAQGAQGQHRGRLLARLETPAYRIYTSGSTGAPKGVEVSHRNLANFALGFRRQAVALGMTGLTTWLWNHSFAFDASMKGYAALAEGATVVLPTAFESKSPEALVGHVEAHAIDVVNFIPSQLRFVLPLLRERELRVHVISSGDAIDRALKDEIHAYCEWAGTRALNAYGPTEVTVNASFGALERGRRTSIGKPVSNVCAWVVGSWGTPQPPGAVGELWLCGESVVLGYRNQEALTAEKFVTVAAGDEALRCYRTGDIVRLDAHGDIVFFGRTDRQTKVRGYRVELKGIEAVARRVAGVEDCAAFCDGDAVQLAIVARSEYAVAELRGRLERDLPSYMIPAHIHSVPAIPYTHSGKLDERRLQRLGRQSPAKDAVQGAGWLEGLLGLPSLDLARSFMQNGGNSMKALALQAEVQRQWGRRIALEPLFADVPLAALLAQWQLEPPQASVNDDLEPGLEPASREQEAMWLAHHADTSGVAYNMAVALHVEGEFPIERLTGAYQRLLETHRALCSYFVLEQGQLVVKHCDPQQLPLPLLVRDHPSPTSSGMAEAVEAISRCFDLDQPYLHRMVLLRHSDRDATILFNIHHILVDGTSVDILMRELFSEPAPGTLEQGARTGNRRVHNSRAPLHEQDLQFWREYLSTCSGTRLPRRAVTSTPAPIEVAAELSPDDTAAFLGACDLHAVTPFQWLLTQVAMHVGQHVDDRDVALLSPLEVRSGETNNVVGLYSRTVAYRTRWSDDETFEALLSRQKQEILSAWQHGSPGIDELRHRLGADLARTISEAGFTWHGARTSDAVHGLTITPRPLPLRAVKYPLWVHARLVSGCLRLELESRSDVLDPRGAQQFLDALVDSLRTTAATPGCRIESLHPRSKVASRPSAALTFNFDF